MMFGEVVREVFRSAFPQDGELFLIHSVSDPVETHIDRFGSLLLHCVIRNSFCASVVRDDDCWGLGMAEFF